MLRKICNFCTLFLSIFLLSRCGEDNNAPVYSPFPIEIKLSTYADGPEISWNQIRSSDFVSYRIWRSSTTDTVPTVNNGAISTTNAFSIGVVDDFEQTTFVDQTTGSFSTLPYYYYRVEAVLKNRSVWSRNIKSTESSSELNASINGVAFDKSTKKIYLFDQIGKKAIKFDSDKESIEATFNLSSSSTIYSSLGKKNNRNELYVAQEESIVVLDADNFTKIDEIALNENVYNLSSDNAGRIFATGIDKLIIVDRNNANKQSFYNAVSTGSGIYKYYFISGKDELLSVESSSKYLTKILKLDASHTNVIGKEIESNLLGIAAGTSINRALILSSDNFVLGDKGYVFNRSLVNLGKLNGQLNISNTIFKDIQAINSTSMIAIISNSNSSSSLTASIIRYQLPNTLLEEKFLSNGTVPLFVIPMGDKNWLVMNKSNSTGKSSIAKIR
jgi:hypothetical protein